MYTHSRGNAGFVVFGSIFLTLLVALSATEALARNNIRDAFFAVYPDAVGTPIETVPSHLNHCGVCHYEFSGGGPRNPYGLAVEAALEGFPSNPSGRRQAILSVENQDADGDGFSAVTEITDTVTFANTPTFPGLTPANVQSVTSVDVLEIQNFLVPSTGGDITPPQVTVIMPNGGEVLVGNVATTVQWSATDVSGVAAIDLFLSDDNGVSFKPIAQRLSNTGSHTWYVANRPTTLAIVRVVATDNAFNVGQNESDGVFTVESPPGGVAPTTLRDFDMPGSQPFEAGILNPPEACAVCHGNYDSNVEPYFNWQGSLMAQASRDVLFRANMVIANQDAPDSGDLCLRCHFPRGWLQGRSVPTDGSEMLSTDFSGVSCDFCHRLVDPIYDPTENPLQDQSILAALSVPASEFGNGMATIDPTGARRGPFLNAATGHPVLVSPFHREAALCGTCHDVSNPAFEKDGNGNFVPNAFDAPATDFSAHTLAPVERTYSEWFYSEYNTPGGVFAPEFGGNLDFVSTCQDCHMRDVTGEGCNFGTPPTRNDLPLHDITGGSTWLPGLLGTLFPGEVDETALQAGIERARYMLQNAAELVVVQEGAQLKVTITNNTRHKLPTGYPEGRRMWINVKFYDAGMALVSESGAYDPATGILSHDAEAKIYDTEPGLDEVTAPLVGVPPGPSFHFVLNNKIFKDNRIPPRGFTNAAYADFGGAPVGHTYADGQYWDDTFYAVPAGATSAEVTLYYQSTSKEFIEFLRDENTTDTRGQDLYDLWNNNQKCPPEIMRASTLALADCSADADCDDGAYCNGIETCDLATNTCQPGTAVDCNDGVDCTVDTCNEDTDSCDTAPEDTLCDNDLFCDGAETCDPLLDCQPGTLVDCDDGVACTVDVCNETTDSCDNTPEDTLCDNDLFCDGAETCDPLLDCQPGTLVDCDDGVACTVDVCNETTDSCDNTPDDAACDDGLFCNGAETCDAIAGCLNGSAACTDECERCIEESDSCAWCVLDLDGSGVIGTGDFALFSPCFGACYSPGDQCLASDFDFDGCVGTADYAAFIDCFGNSCGACVSCAGLGGGASRAIVASKNRTPVPMSASVRIVSVRTETPLDSGLQPPRSVRSFAVGEDVIFELWAVRAGLAGDALASVYVDLMYDPEVFEITGAASSAQFGVLARQLDDSASGLLLRLGGCAALGERALGINDSWVRVATIVARATSPGNSSLAAMPSDRLHGIAAIGFGNIDPTRIEFGSVEVMVHRKGESLSNGR